MAVRRGQKFKVMGLHCSTMHTNIVVVYTGEKRAPKRGEFFISGAVPTAYKATHDMDSIHLIAVRETEYRETVEQDTKLKELEYKLMSVITAHAQSYPITQSDTVELLESIKNKIAKV